MSRFLDNFEGPLLFALILCLIAFGILMIADSATGDHESIGIHTVEDRSHAASTVQAVPVYGPDGNMSVAVFGDPERWEILCTKAGQVVPVKVTPQQWAKFKPGEKVELYRWRGGIIGGTSDRPYIR